MRIPDLIASKLDSDDQLLNVVVRPIESTRQTISVYFRQCSHLHSLSARMFYGNDMLSQNPTREHEKDYMALVGHIRSVIDPANSIKPSKDGRFRVKFRGAVEQKSGCSFRNTSHAGCCLDKAIAITKTGARCIPPRADQKAKMLILCLYAEQLLEYKSRIREMVERDTSRSLFSSIDLCTLDSSRGKEADIVFVDFVRTEGVGFCDDAYRVCQSLTRSKGCEIILMNESMTFRRRSKRLEYILDHVPNVVTQECYEYCGDHRHTTEDCSSPERCTICEGMEEHPRARCPDTYCPNCRQKGHAVSACAQPRRAQKKPGKRK